MLTIGIPQLYCGASGQKGAYNRQEIGLARALARKGCRAVAFYPAVGAETVEREEIEPNVTALYLPARAVGTHAFFGSWQPLLAEGVRAVHVMGDTSLGVPGLYRFCQKNGIAFYSQLGAVQSDADSAAKRFLMDALARPNFAIYKKTPTYAKTPAVAAQLAARGVPCAGVMPVGLDTALIPPAPAGETKAALRGALGLSPAAKTLLFVGRLDAYKQPMDLPAVLAALPDWRAVVIGDGALAAALDEAMAAPALAGRYKRIPCLPNAQVQRYYRACDAFLNLNAHEIFGMSLLEAMWAGCPPVARHAPGPDLIVENGVSGLLADTPQALAAALEQAAAAPALGAAAHARVAEHFLWDTAAAMALAMLAQKGVREAG